MAASPEWSARAAALGVGTMAFAVYAFACAPTAYLLDSAELAGTAFGLGVAHPPGEPLALLLGKLFTLLPLGPVALRVGLSQAAAGALAVALVCLIVLRLLRRLDPDGQLGPGTRALLGAGAALVFAFAPGAIIVAVRPEVYALQTALSLGAVLCALRALDDADPRPLLIAALLLGLGLANHPLVAGLAGLGPVLAALPFLQRGRRARVVGVSVAAVIVGALVIAYVPVRAVALHTGGQADTLAWGDARSARGLAWVLSARTFADKASIVHTSAQPQDLPWVLVEELEMAGALLAPIGLLAILRKRGARLAAAVVVTGAVGTVIAALVAGMDPANPDVRGYLGTALALLAALAGVAIGAGLLPVRIPRLRPALAALLVMGALGRIPSPAHYPGLRDAGAADGVTRALLDGLAPRGALLTAHFETAFLVAHHRVVEGRRPDVAWAHLGFARSPGYAARVGSAYPALGAVLEAHARRPLDLATARALDQRHPLRLEPDPHVDRALRARLFLAGASWTLRSGEATGALDVAPEVAREADDDRQVRGFLALRAYQDAALACERGLHAVARERLQALGLLAPQDARAAALRATCLPGSQ